MKVAETQRNNLNFSKLFEPYVIDIQSHGHRLFTKHVPQLNLDAYLVHGNNGGTYVNSNLMRDQMDGIIHFLHLDLMKKTILIQELLAQLLEVCQSSLLHQTTRYSGHFLP